VKEMNINELSSILVNYIEENKIKHNIDYYDTINTLQEMLGNIKKDYKDMQDSFLNEQYEKMKEYIYNTSDEELKRHNVWYKVDYGDKVELVDTMFESYCNTYDDKELEKRINDLLEED
jgi:hypothetical protein